MRTVLFITYPGIKLLDLAGPLQVFTDTPDLSGAQPPYRSIVASLDGGTVTTDTGINVETVSLRAMTRRKIDTLLIVGGSGSIKAATNPELLQLISRLARRVKRVGSICTGTFPLAATGLLDGKRAVTHWDSCEALAAQYGNIKVESDPIYINDDGYWTSAGVTAGIDLALAMVTEDLGRKTALKVARSLVMHLVRPGGQSQFGEIQKQINADRESRFDDLHRWITKNLGNDLRVENLASYEHMSVRNFTRHYVNEIGLTPAKAVEKMRIEAARRLLEESQQSISAIAIKCGFIDDERMRRAFIRNLKVSPGQYRERFRN